MSILFSAIAIGTQVLAQCASCVGNFTEVITEILSKIPPQDGKLTYNIGNYLFHYIAENKLVYFCITDDKFPRPKAFSFLNEIHKRFQTSFEDVPLAAIPYAALKHAADGDFSRIMENEMKRFNDNKITIPRVKAELKELKSIMVQNVDKAALIGERLENLVNRADDLAETTHTYRTTSVRVQRKYWWKNIKMYIILVAVSLVAVYFIGAMACGGLTWRNCVG